MKGLKKPVMKASKILTDPLRGLENRPSFLKAGRRFCAGLGSNSETIEVAVALDIHGQVRVVVRPFLVFRELDVSHRFGKALVIVGRLLHCGREVLQVRERRTRVVLGSDLAAIRAGMTRDQPFPFHGNYFFEPVFDVRQVSVGHAAERHRASLPMWNSAMMRSSAS